MLRQGDVVDLIRGSFVPMFDAAPYGRLNARGTRLPVIPAAFFSMLPVLGHHPEEFQGGATVPVARRIT
jgi:hypothetical protein